MKYKFESPENIAKFIKTSPKSTPVKAYINGDLKKLLYIIWRICHYKSLYKKV